MRAQDTPLTFEQRRAVYASLAARRQPQTDTADDDERFEVAKTESSASENDSTKRPGAG